MKHLAAFLAVAALLVACTHETIYKQESAPNEAVPAELMTLGADCSTNKSCADGLTCLNMALNGECTDTVTCTKECKKDSDCTPLHPSAVCLEGCDGKNVCTRTQ
jgi:hypothetical protein